MTVPKLTPRPSQEAAIIRMLAEPTKGILIASEMGTGKTLVAAEFAIRAGLERVLLIGVKDTYDQWAERLEAQSDGAIQLRRLDSEKDGRVAFADFLAGRAGFYFAGSQYLVAQDWDHADTLGLDGLPIPILDKVTGEPAGKVERHRIHLQVYKKMAPVDAIIFDEIHVVANRKSIGRRTLISIRTEWRLAMSGTWYRNSFEGAWSVTLWLWPHLIDTAFSRWCAEWCAIEEVYLPGGKTATKITGERTPGLYVTTLPLYIREEAYEQPPAPFLIHVNLSPAQRAQYEEVERDMILWADTHDGGRDFTVMDAPIVVRSRLRTATLGEMSFDSSGDINFAMDTRSSKLQALRGLLDSPLWTRRAVAIYTDSKKFAKVTVARMQAAGYNAVEWSGDVSSKERAAIKARFLAGEVQYLVCVIGAFNAGLDGFQTVCNRVVWLSEAEGDGTLNDQALARFFRPGRMGEFMHAKILANDTHDVGIYSAGVLAAIQSRKTLTLAA